MLDPLATARSRALEVISGFDRNRFPGFDLYNGTAGILLFLLCSGHLSSESRKKWIELFLAKLRAQAFKSILPLGFYGGFWGIWWLFQKLDQETSFRGVKSELDRLTPVYYHHSLKSSTWRTRSRDAIHHGDYDLVSGVVGFAASHLNEKSFAREAALNFTLDYLDQTKIEASDGYSWRNSYAQGFNTGIAHGQSGVILLLSRLAKEGRKNALPLLEGALTKLRYLGRLHPGAGFPPDSKSDGSRQPTSTWCHGDRGIGYSIARAGSALGDREVLNWGREVFTRGAGHSGYRRQTGLALCHGRVANLVLDRLAEEKLGIRPEAPHEKSLNQVLKNFSLQTMKKAEAKNQVGVWMGPPGWSLAADFALGLGRREWLEPYLLEELT